VDKQEVQHKKMIDKQQTQHDEVIGNANKQVRFAKCTLIIAIIALFASILFGFITRNRTEVTINQEQMQPLIENLKTISRNLNSMQIVDKDLTIYKDDIEEAKKNYQSEK